MPPRRSSTLRRLGQALAATAVVGAGVWLLLGALRDEAQGFPVDVEVVDEAGRPVADARVEARYAPGWRRVDARGRVRLAGVVLRAGETWTEESVGAAISVEAPSHAPLPEHLPEVERGADGVWRARFTLGRHGVIRVTLAATPLPGVRAWVEARGGTGRVEAERGIEVARLGQPATWRVYPGVERLVVCLEGERGVAAQRRLLEAPSPGYLREVVLEAHRARPIRGRVLVEGEAPPTLAGALEVAALADGEDPLPLPAVVVAPDGTFEVPYAGEGRYELRPVLGFADDVPPATARGGADLELRGGRAAAWAAIDASGWAGPEGTVRVLAAGTLEATAPRPHGVIRQGDEVLVALPRAGAWVLDVERPGDETRAPERGRAEVAAAGAGGHAVDVPLERLPTGTVVVRAASGAASGAGVVRLEAGRQAREATWLPALAPEARFENVPAGPVRATVLWRDEGRAPSVLAGHLEGGGTVALEVP